jgi:hypothetical protein
MIKTLKCIFIFIFGGHPNPGSMWWMILPFLFMSIAIGLSGIIFYWMDPLRYQGGWKKTTANIISILAFCLLFSIAFELGMNGPN